MKKCANCDAAVVKMAVEGHVPGGECIGCGPSTSGGPSTATLTLSDVETVSLGSYSLGNYPAASTSAEYATSTGYEGRNDSSTSKSGPDITPTPFSSAPEASGNMPYDPPAASATYVTAGSARILAHGRCFGFVVVAIIVLAW